MPCTCGKQARAAEEVHVAAELLAALAAVVAAAAGVRRRHRDLVADLHARDAGADAPRRRADASWPGNQRLAHDEAAVAALEIVVEVGAADAAGAEAQQHLARAGVGRVDRLRCAGLPWRECGKPAWIRSSFAMAVRGAVARAHCSVSQPVEKRLYAWFRCRCIAARAPRGVVRGDRLQHRAMLGHRGASTAPANRSDARAACTAARCARPTAS